MGKKTIKTVRPSLAESAWIWGKLGLLSFGGPTAQIALMHRLIVAERRWPVSYTHLTLPTNREV